MQILADHCVPAATIEALRAAGLTVHRLADVAGASMADARVAELAASRGWLLLTADRDFRLEVTYHRRQHPGVVLLRDVQTHRDAVHRRLVRLLRHPPKRLASGIAVVDRRSCRLTRTG